MGNRLYLTISGTVFSLVALVHLVRIIEDWYVQVAHWSVPMAFSWGGFVITLTLALSAFNLLFRENIE